MRIRVDEKLLSDSSPVYDVTLNDGHGSLTLHAVTESDALQLADKLGDIIREHSTDTTIITTFGERIEQ